MGWVRGMGRVDEGDSGGKRVIHHKKTKENVEGGGERSQCSNSTRSVGLRKIKDTNLQPEQADKQVLNLLCMGERDRER